jgi:hypothetical protein
MKYEERFARTNESTRQKSPWMATKVRQIHALAAKNVHQIDPVSIDGP